MNIFDIYPDIMIAPVEIRMCRAKAADTPPEILEQLSKDMFWYVRNLVACNRNTPVGCLLELTQDSDFRIRCDAEKTLAVLQAAQNEMKLPLNEQINTAALRTDEHRTMPIHHSDYRHIR